MDSTEFIKRKITDKLLLDGSKMRDEYNQSGGFSSSGPEEDDEIRDRRDLINVMERSLYLAMQALYQMDISFAQVLSENSEAKMQSAVRTCILSDVLYSDQNNENIRKAVTYLFDKVVSDKENIDSIIKKHVTCNWDIERMTPVDRALLRLGTAGLHASSLEVLAPYFDKKCGISFGNEPEAKKSGDLGAALIKYCCSTAETYSEGKSKKFVRGVLLSIKKTLAENK